MCTRSGPSSVSTALRLLPLRWLVAYSGRSPPGDTPDGGLVRRPAPVRYRIPPPASKRYWTGASNIAPHPSNLTPYSNLQANITNRRHSAA
ncbi:hypothetical protein G6F54_014366 [Rhizopus delemar]|nr:hypothetical protein G6F54_014366 [Rhizopus delemar]